MWRDSVPSAAGELVLGLCEELVDGYARRRGPMPVVVVHAAGVDTGADADAGPEAGPEADGRSGEDTQAGYDDRVREIVDLVHRAQKPRWLLCRSVDPPPVTPPAPQADRDVDTPDDAARDDGARDDGAREDVVRLDDRTYAATTSLVKDVAEGQWENHNRSQYRPYRLPRSRLMAALDQAVDEVRADSEGVPDPRAVVARLTELRWQPGAHTGGGAGPGRGGAGFWRSLGAMLSPATTLGAAVVACVGVLAAKANSWSLTWVVLGTVLALVAGFWVRRRASPLWLGSGCRWFATTTFPVSPSAEAPVWSPWRPRLSRHTLEERAVEVARQLLAAAGPDTPADTAGPAGRSRGRAAERGLARQFCLQLRTLALLEDLRDNHRPAWDLRHRKRTVPPLLLIPRATRANGALPFLRAVSDVRSRRSEQDPLLVVAGVAHADLAGLRERTPLPLPAPGAYRREPGELYQAWVERSLRTGQAPSMSAALPWVLPVALTGDLLDPYDPEAGLHRYRTRRVPYSPWLFWSRWTLAVSCVLATTGGTVYYRDLTRDYCGGREAVWNRDLVRTPGGECVGVASGHPLDVDAKSALLLGAGGKQIGLKVLQERIAEANDAVGDDPRHITLVFAGALTAQRQEHGEATDVLRQLAGVYLAQRFVNDFERSNSDLKMRVVVANAGQRMRYQKDMAHKIVDFARRDRSVVGVVGMGIHTEDSDDTVRIFQQAGLPVIGTTNSATGLAAQHHNYVGVAATDQEEASALVDSVKPADGRSAVVLVPQGSGGLGDSYSADQARYAAEALAEADFVLQERIEYPKHRTSGNFDQAARTICEKQTEVVYLAGLASHVTNLMTKLARSGCDADHPVTVLSGDDMTKKPFADTTMDLPPGARLRYAALTCEKKLVNLDVYDLAKEAFALKREPTAGEPLFADGFAALSYDAAIALHEAASNAGVPGNGQAPAVLAALHAVDFENGLTGRISFRNADVSDPGRRGHGIGLYEVTRSKPGADLDVDFLYGRAAGETGPLKEAKCVGKAQGSGAPSPSPTPTPTPTPSASPSGDGA